MFVLPQRQHYAAYQQMTVRLPAAHWQTVERHLTGPVSRALPLIADMGLQHLERAGRSLYIAPDGQGWTVNQDCLAMGHRPSGSQLLRLFGAPLDYAQADRKTVYIAESLKARLSEHCALPLSQSIWALFLFTLEISKDMPGGVRIDPSARPDPVAPERIITAVIQTAHPS